MKKLICGIAGVLALGIAGTAAAVPVTFELDAQTSSVSLTSFQGDFLCHATNCQPTFSLNPQLESLSRTLTAGQTWAFDLFSIDFHGVGGGSGSLSASLGFDAPSTAKVATGSGVGGFFNFIVTSGNLQWTSQPGSFNLSDGTRYSVLFENLSGITFGKTDVRAFLTLNTEPGAVGVPEPGTLTLFGLGLLGIGLANRRRAARKTG